MNVSPKNITIKELVNGYQNNQEAGVCGFGGVLNIRPPYQREFVYDDEQRNAVIDTVTKGFPLNTMYWAVTHDGFELLDGQQRTMSICQYVDGVFSYKDRYFHNLQQNEKDAILSYQLTVYQCQGADSEKLDWFRTINIAGEELTEQELRNAVYAGSWTADAKRYFSKTQCAAWQLADKYMKGSPIRQEYLETAISWINEGKIEEYMATHQHDQNANDLWMYFQNVINWVTLTFTSYRREMKNVPWGPLYNQFGKEQFDTSQLEQEVAHLMQDQDVTSKPGIYSFVLSRDERKLSIRTFDEVMKREAYECQKGMCPKCGKPFEIEQMHADHIKPWSKGGRTIAENCRMLCAADNRSKSDT